MTLKQKDMAVLSFKPKDLPLKKLQDLKVEKLQEQERSNTKPKVTGAAFCIWEIAVSYLALIPR